MNMQHFIIIIEADMDRLDQAEGTALSNQIVQLKQTIDSCGSMDLYSVKDINALKKFKAEIKRLNP